MMHLFLLITTASPLMANLFLLSQYFEDKKYEVQSLQILKNIFPDALANPAYYSNYARNMLLQSTPPFVIAIVGDDWKEKLSGLQTHFLPNVLFMGGEIEGKLPSLKGKLVPFKTLIYVCRNKICQRPVEKVGEALRQLGKVS